MPTVKLDDAQFEDAIRGDKPVLVDFWAEWCGPCRMIAPALEELSDEFADRVTIAKVNIEESFDTPAKYGVRNIPTLILFKNGKPASTKLGAEPKNSLKRWLETELG